MQIESIDLTSRFYSSVEVKSDETKLKACSVTAS
jgi:hypothetical protein